MISLYLFAISIADDSDALLAVSDVEYTMLASAF